MFKQGRIFFGMSAFEVLAHCGDRRGSDAISLMSDTHPAPAGRIKSPEGIGEF
jgi:hypothetical protein